MLILPHRRIYHRQPPSGIITDGLIHRWAMDEGAGSVIADSVGGQNATMVGLDPGTAWVTAPDASPAVDFALNGHLALASLITLSGDFSCVGWIDFRSLGSLVLGLGEYNHVLYSVSGTLIRMRVTALDIAPFTVFDPINTGWRRFGVSRRNNIDAALYIDGILNDTQALTTTSVSAVQYFGGLPDTTLRINASMRDIRLYDRVLSADEFLDHGTGVG